MIAEVICWTWMTGGGYDAVLSEPPLVSIRRFVILYGHDSRLCCILTPSGADRWWFVRLCFSACLPMLAEPMFIYLCPHALTKLKGSTSLSLLHYRLIEIKHSVQILYAFFLIVLLPVSNIGHIES